jgi:hypothetical protein
VASERFDGSTPIIAMYCKAVKKKPMGMVAYNGHLGGAHELSVSSPFINTSHVF